MAEQCCPMYYPQGDAYEFLFQSVQRSNSSQIVHKWHISESQVLWDLHVSVWDSWCLAKSHADHLKYIHLNAFCSV